MAGLPWIYGLVGGFSPPLEKKNMSSSIGMIVPNIWENAKNGNQTTNQIWAVSWWILMVLTTKRSWSKLATKLRLGSSSPTPTQRPSDRRPWCYPGWNFDEICCFTNATHSEKTQRWSACDFSTLIVFGVFQGMSIHRDIWKKIDVFDVTMMFGFWSFVGTGHIKGRFLKYGYPKSSISTWDLPWNKQSSYWGTPMAMESPKSFLKGWRPSPSMG